MNCHFKITHPSVLSAQNENNFSRLNSDLVVMIFFLTSSNVHAYMYVTKHLFPWTKLKQLTLEYHVINYLSPFPSFLSLSPSLTLIYKVKGYFA